MAFNLTKRLENLEERGLKVVKDELEEVTQELQSEMDSLLEDNRVRYSVDLVSIQFLIDVIARAATETSGAEYGDDSAN